MKHSQTYKHMVFRTRLLLFTIVPLLLPLGAIAMYQWLPVLLLKYFFFTKGLVAWTLTEYAMHRWAYHGRKASDAHEREAFNHAYHHTHPGDIIVKPWMRWGLLLVVPSGAWLLSTGPVLLSYGIGFVVGFAIYNLMHYILHQPIAARVFPTLVRQHIWHHCKYPNQCFGVCTTLWDRVFKTLPPEFAIVPQKTVAFYFKHRDISEEGVRKIYVHLLNTNKTMVWTRRITGWGVAAASVIIVIWQLT